MNCTVDVREDRAEAWAPAQDSSWVLRSVHEVTGLPDEKIRVHTTFLGGGFGRRAHGDFAVEAAQVSQGVKAPVQVAWTREDDIRHDFYRPAARHVVRAGLDPQGRPTAWMHRMASPAIAAMWSAMFGGAPPESSEVGGIVNLPYAIPNLRVEYSLAASPVPVMWWRSVAHSGNAFVVESFLDEIAHAAGVDPLELRLKLLAGERQVTDPYEAGQVLETQRLAAVIRLAAEKAGWGAPLPPGRGRGIAAHFCFYSYACHVVEASAPKGGQIQVHRVVTAVDCGRVVNPDGVAAQMESAVVFGLSAALKGKITVADGRVEQGNFDGYDVVRMGEAPLVETYLVPSDAPPTGTGEPGLPPVAPALANALFAATGKRVRRLPITPQDLA
jgi:isoquinoline 1-oxidoreductase beta subunit